ncbi:MAG: M81 family metallopeptidase [Clostridia bacterium]|nr:M81 family metallopeptidase [Clostridia bacterium]
MSNQKKRIYVCGLHQESNSFNPVLMREERFSTWEGDEVAGFYGRNRGIIGGMIDTLVDSGAELIYGRYMTASSGGPLEDAVALHFIEKALADIAAAGKLDGIAIALHGATMSASSDDVCGDILAAIRAAVGEEMPIAAGFDLHANITEKISQNADYACGYQTYPHLDQHGTGVRAATLLLRHLSGKVGKTAYARVPVIAPAHAYTTESGALKLLVDEAKALVEGGEILDYTIFEAQPWLDTPEIAAAVVVTAENAEKAREVADHLAKRQLEIRRELQGTPLFDVDDVIEKALANKSGKPVVLVDSADSRGAGSTADSAAVIEALLPHRGKLRAAVGVCDAPAVEEAFRVGVGNCADFTLGATIAPDLSRPVTVKNALVRSLHNGEFFAVGPSGRGDRSRCGRVAVLDVDGILIQVSSASRNEKDIGFFRGFGIDPELCQLVSVKACTSFRAAYGPIAAEICNTATPGAAGTVLTALPYKHRPEPLYPFEEIGVADIREAVCYR